MSDNESDVVEAEIEELLASIREACGSIQTRVEQLDSGRDREELEELWEWAEETSAGTYEWSDE